MKIDLSWNDVLNDAQTIIRQIHNDTWRPDIVAGVLDSSMITASLISEYLNVPLRTVDGGISNSEVTLAREASGFVPERERTQNGGYDAIEKFKKNILIVVNVNNSDTLGKIRFLWEQLFRSNYVSWDRIWGENVRVAALYEIDATSPVIPVTYGANFVPSVDDLPKVTLPWQNWWIRKD